MRSGSYSVKIICGSVALPEYGVETNDGSRPKTASCYVPSSEGKEFGIDFHLSDGSEDIQITILADGVILEKRMALKQKKGLIGGVIVSDTEERAFVFDLKQALVEGDAEGQEGTPDQEFSGNPCRGTITVELRRVEITYLPPKPARYLVSKEEDMQTVALGRTKTRNSHNQRSFTFAYHHGGQPMRIFTFHHRSQAWIDAFQPNLGPVAQVVEKKERPPSLELPDFSALSLID